MMQRFLTVLGYVALAVFGLWMATIALDVLDDIAYEVYWWTRYRLLPGVMWAGGIGVVLYGLYLLFRGGN